MFFDIIQIAFLCIVLGGASIPFSFTVNNNPFIVWVGNALGSLISAVVVIYIANRVTDKKFKREISKSRIGKKVVTAFDEGEENKKAKKASGFINKHGLKLFSLVCPIFPGVLISTVVVYALNLDKKTFVHWMLTGVFFVSGGYVFAYWWAFIR